MKFYNRDTEIADLKNIEEKSKNKAQMTIFMGRRRLGKNLSVFCAVV